MANPRIVVGAHYGLRDWLAQRLSAVVVAIYTVILLIAVLSIKELDYDSWARLFSSVWMKVLTLLALLALLYHAWVGVRNVLMDYVKPAGIRLSLQALTIVTLSGYAIWAATILWRV
jgi:succinate dehydrogenase / fumarate reductase, membrane anchor subunit